MKKKIYLVALICFVLDIISKFLVTYFLDSEIVIVPDFFSLFYTKNTGGAFSIFSGGASILALIGIGAVFFINKYMLDDSTNRIDILAYGFLLGGIFGNLVERIFFKEVTDFLKFNILGYSFPIFNIADVFICVGGFLLILGIVRGEVNDYKSRR